MVMDKLHMICGNCGCSDMWSWEYIPEEITGPDEKDGANVYITCENCGTVHSLNKYAKKMNEFDIN